MVGLTYTPTIHGLTKERQSLSDLWSVNAFAQIKKFLYDGLLIVECFFDL